MADLSKLKRSRLGPPPTAEEASLNLSAPETIPLGLPEPDKNPSTKPSSDPLTHMASRIDGRSLRRTNRVIPLALRVTPEFDNRLRTIAARDRILLAEVLERALAAYEERTAP
ncbi:MAG TPA: hypothetical protein VM715_05485 [Candidatus Acidoferrum sp.]|jgi:hypothetical protein|nr:hypothetical protein [Candidatus Acidoferrum sp.]